MWECDWHQRLQDQPEVADYVASLHLQPPLQPREAFFGGRTNVVQLHRTDAQGEEIRHYDYTSLYPWVNKNARSPMGHLELIYAPNTVDLHPYFCLVKCTVLPPPGLYHPVLRHRTGEKLTFPLCRTCVENQLDRPLHDKTTGADGHLVHPRTEQSRGARLRGAENLRSVAFCPKLTRAFHRVCKYLAENQRRGQRVASRLYDPGKPGPTPPRLRATGRHPTGL